MIAAACTAPPPVTAPSTTPIVQTPIASPTVAATPSPVPLPTAGPGALSFAAQMAASDGVLAAAVRLEVPAPSVARMEVAAADLRAAPMVWRTIATFDAFPTGISVSNRRVALGLYREPAGAGGGSSAEIVVVDAASSAWTSIWSATFTPATFRGGGGGPKRATARFVLGDGRLAYTRLTEVAGGELAGELRVRDLGNGRETVIGSSPRWIEPIAFSGSLLAYSIAGDPLDEVRQVDLAAGATTTTIVQAPLIRAHAFSGRWLVYTTTQSEQAGPHKVVLRDVAAGTERVLDTNGDRLSVNERYAVWRALDSRTFKAFDVVNQREADILQPRTSLVDLTAVPGGFVAHDMGSGVSSLSFVASP